MHNVSMGIIENNFSLNPTFYAQPDGVRISVLEIDEA